MTEPAAVPVTPVTLVAPVTRWALTGEHRDGFGPGFAAMIAEGRDVDGEARVADALLPRGGRVLDAGSGMGRVGAALQARGHDVVAVEVDAALVAQSRTTYPDLPVVEADLLTHDPGPGASYDLVVCVGNVLVYLAEGTEVAVLRRLRSWLAPAGRVLAGFQLVATREGARDYPASDFVADAAAAGLRVDHRFGTWDLRRADDGYGVWVLSAAD